MDDFNLEGLDLRTTGRAKKPVQFSVVRPLTREDFDATLGEREESVKPIELKALRSRHHRLARLLAEGVKETVAAAACGYTRSRVSILKSDPAFRELMLSYSEEVDMAYYDMHEAMSEVGNDAVSELAERLEENPEDFTINQLLEMAKTMADRTGHGPSQQVNVDVRHGLSDRLENARKRKLELRNITPDREDE